MSSTRIRGFEVVKGWEEREVMLPVRSTPASAGYDFFAAESIEIPPDEIRLIPTGVKAYMQPDEFLKLVNRSSNPIKRNLVLANGVGIVDADYYGNPTNDGHIMFAFWNVGKEPVYIYRGERIGQGIFMKYLTADNDTVLQSARSGGFGSTGA